MYQRWQSLTFLHWSYAISVIRAFVPPELEIDSFDGRAWVGVTPFLVVGLRPPVLPAIPYVSTFPETNVRTYVIDREGKRGVWFFSLDADRLLAVTGARLGYALPYFWANMTVDERGPTIRYTSKRIHGRSAASHIAVEAGEAIEYPNDLELFLTARFRLYAKRGPVLLRANVDHPPWPLHNVTVTSLEQTLTRAAGLPPGEGPIAHFSPGVDVRVALPGIV